VVIPAEEVDVRGLHVCNVAGMRRAFAALPVRPDYALTDGFPVAGVGVPGLAVWKGDRVAACVAAASVLAKVTRDRIMVDLDREFPAYGFAEHKGYVTDDHTAALNSYGPCLQHRFSYANVAAVHLDEVVGSAGRRRRSTVSVAAVAIPGGDAGSDGR
jgi:ribonuclease HII